MVETVRRGAASIGHRLTSPNNSQATVADQFLRPLKIQSKMGDDKSVRRYYEMLEMYAASLALYDAFLQREWDRGKPFKDVRSLMTPANAVIQYYAASIWAGSLPDALPIEAEDEEELETLKEAIHGIWDASSWGKNKQVCVRMGIRLGDVFLKSCQRDADGYPYIQIIHPWYVTEFETNERNNITYIRLDMPQEEVQTNTNRRLIETEVWDKDAGTYRFWQHYEDLEAEIEKLGDPDIELNLSAGDGPNDLGFDFIPFTHIKARDTGEHYGQPPILPALDKIDELNMMATDHNDDLFRHNKAKYAISSNMVDAEGRPVVPPQMYDADGDVEIIQRDIGGETVYVLPGLSAISALGSGIDWTAKADSIEKSYEFLTKTDLPELRWYTLDEAGAMAGVALRRIMAPAISNTIETRGNFETGLIAAQQMCMTLGQLEGIEEFVALVPWEEGGLRHKFEERDVMPLSEDEVAKTDMARQSANTMMINNGYTQRYVITKIDNVSEDDYEEMLAEEQRTAGPSIDEDVAAIEARASEALAEIEAQTDIERPSVGAAT